MKFLFVIGIIVLIGSIFLIFSKKEEWDVYKNGQIVQMKIERLPTLCIGSKVRYFVAYSYEGQIFEKATRGNFCERHKVGEPIDMKYLRGSRIILRPDESVIMDIVSLMALGLLGAGISISQWKKISSIS